MSTLIVSDKKYAVIGLGKTGWSCAHYLTRAGASFIMLDTRAQPPRLAEFKQQFPDVPIELGELDVAALSGVDEVIVSPGVPLLEPALQQARAKGIPLVGDVQVFLRECRAPIIAITGSNAKSTVTTLVGNMIARAGKKVAVGGNIGTPVLDLLAVENPDFYVLELSSFQLETLSGLNALVATVLNISEDHKDRYDNLLSYYQAKHRIYHGARHVVFNRAQRLTAPLVAPHIKQFSFALDEPDLGQFGLLCEGKQEYLAQGLSRLMPVAEIRLPGRHNIENVLAALAIGTVAAIPLDVMLDEIRSFPGLSHRCQFIAEIQGVSYYNDSKGTNVGATVAAIQGLGKPDARNIVLIAGGQSKGVSLDEIKPVLCRYGKGLVVIGEAAAELEQLFAGHLPVTKAGSMLEAVTVASGYAAPGDSVLLSPACASFDMFKNFEDRGNQFVQAVQSLTSTSRTAPLSRDKQGGKQ